MGAWVAVKEPPAVAVRRCHLHSSRREGIATQDNGATGHAPTDSQLTPLHGLSRLTPAQAAARIGRLYIALSLVRAHDDTLFTTALQALVVREAHWAPLCMEACDSVRVCAPVYLNASVEH